MNHTILLLLGKDLQGFSKKIKEYAVKYGENGPCEYLQVLNVRQDEGGWLGQFVEKKNKSADLSELALDERYRVVLAEESRMDTDEEMRLFFSNLYNRTITVNNPGGSTKLQLLVVYPLYRDGLFDKMQSMLKNINGIHQEYTIDILGIASDLSPLFLENQEKENIATLAAGFEDNMRKTVDSLLALQESGYHRLLMMQNCNSLGVSLDLDEDSFARILGELSFLFVESYQTLFPLTTEGRPVDICAFGLSCLNLDKYYFIEYLLKKAYLSVLKREQVSQTEVDVNKVSHIAQGALEGETALVSSFFNGHVVPLLEKQTSENDIIVDISPKIDEEVRCLTDKFQSFILSPELSLPEKQAAMAQLLGEDDELLSGVQYNQSQLIIDDCEREAVNMFVEANNSLVRTETDSEGEERIIPGVLTAPCGEDKKVYYPIDEIKALRTKIKGSTQYIRQQGRLIEKLEGQMKDEVESQKRLTENGFVFDHKVYKLSDVEERPLEETYVPSVKPLDSVDLRDNFTPIKDQGSLGACSVFSMASIFESILKKNHREDVDLSELFTYHNVSEKDGVVEDKGSSFYDVIKSMAEYGICLEKYWKYSVEDFPLKPSPDAYQNALEQMVKEAKNVEVNHHDLVCALSEGYPIAISLKIFDSFKSDSNGFIYRPTEDEINSGEYGNHALVLCGYSERDKIYIVRNSWGETFGDKGYCYIPFSYIEDKNLNRAACIITEINSGLEIKGYDAHKAVSFNVTDLGIKYAISRILLDEEKKKLSDMEEEYRRLRKDAEYLIQSLRNNTIRSEIETRCISVQKGVIVDLHRQEQDAVSERERQLSEFDSSQWAGIILTSVVALISLLGFVACFLFDNESGNTLWKWISASSVVAFGLWAALLWNAKANRRKVLDKALTENIGNVKSVIVGKERELAVVRLKYFIAGAFLDKLSDLHIELQKKYLFLKSYVGNLAVWEKEVQQRMSLMEATLKEPFLSLLENSVLDGFFQQKESELTSEIRLYKLLDGYELNENAIRSYKLSIERVIADALEKTLADFSLSKHLMNRIHYPYLDNNCANMETMLPVMDRKCQYFLKSSVTSVGGVAVEKSVLIHVGSDTEKRQWESTYHISFEFKPIAGYVASPFKMILLQRMDLKKDEVEILQKTDE